MPPNSASPGLSLAGLDIPEAEINFSAIRAQGPGGQHVNKASTAVQLKFDIASSAALADDQRQRLMSLRDRRISRDGMVTIKAQRSRSREANRQDALQRLAVLLTKGLTVKPPRRKTRPSKAAKQKRVDTKTRRGRIKSLRKKPDD